MSDPVLELAKDFHETYERIAAGEGWETQQDCRVEFDDLPDANRNTMLAVCAEIHTRHLAELQRERDEAREVAQAQTEEMVSDHELMMNLQRERDELKHRYDTTSRALNLVKLSFDALALERDELREELKWANYDWNKDPENVVKPPGSTS